MVQVPALTMIPKLTEMLATKNFVLDSRRLANSYVPWQYNVMRNLI